MNNIGVGLESEGFFLNTEGQGVSSIPYQNKSIPTSEYVLTKIAERYPQIIPYISPELVSVTFEVKSDVHHTFAPAVEQIFYFKECINTVLQGTDAQLHFIPVLEKEYRAIPSISSQDSLVSMEVCSSQMRHRIWNVLDAFGYHEAQEDSNHFFHGSTIASLQINDSRILARRPKEVQYQDLVDIYNALLSQKNTLLQHNTQHYNYQSKSRLECYVDFLTYLKKDQFTSRGMDPSHIVFPELFHDEEELLAYFAAHANKDHFDESIDAKNINGFMKYKPSIQATEIRVLDTQENPEKALDACHTYDTILKESFTFSS